MQISKQISKHSMEADCFSLAIYLKKKYIYKESIKTLRLNFKSQRGAELSFLMRVKPNWHFSNNCKSFLKGSAWQWRLFFLKRLLCIHPTLIQIGFSASVLKRGIKGNSLSKKSNSGILKMCLPNLWARLMPVAPWRPFRSFWQPLKMSWRWDKFCFRRPAVDVSHANGLFDVCVHMYGFTLAPQQIYLISSYQVFCNFMEFLKKWPFPHAGISKSFFFTKVWLQVKWETE